MSLNPKIFHRSWLHTEHDPEGPPPDTGRRWKVFRLVALLALLLLGCRLWQLQVLETDRFSTAAADNRFRRFPVEAPRGVFYDRNGEQLTTNTPLWQVSLTLADMPDDEVEYQAALRRLEERLDRDWVVYVDAAELPQEDRGGLIERIATATGISPQEVGSRIRESEELETPVLLREEVMDEQSSSLTSALGPLPGVGAVLRLQWLVEQRGAGAMAYRPVVVAENLPRETALAVEGERLQIPGVSVSQVAARGYSDAPLFSSVIGYVGKIQADQIGHLQRQARELGQRPYALDETVGKAGLESVLERYLRGIPGAQEVEVTSTNRVVREGRKTEPVPGNNVVLTLDRGLQAASTDALSRAMKESGAESGAVVALDPRNGQVLALVSLPSYDNNVFTGGISQAEYDTLQADPGRPLLNKAISGQYLPGSVLKPFVAAAALAERVVDPATEHRCGGRIETPSANGTLQRTVYPDWNPRDRGQQDIREALASNCDTYFYIVSGPQALDSRGQPLSYYLPGAKEPTLFRGLGIERINRFLDNFGFGKLTGVELPGEAAGLVADPEWKLRRFPGDPWTLADTLRTAIGNGYTTVTPLQMATATAAVANGGTLYKPDLVLKVTDARGEDVTVSRPERTGHAGMTAEHLETVREGMLRAVEGGAAADLRRQGLLPRDVNVAAMTGTPTAVQEDRNLPVLSWFTAFAPYEQPEIAVAVVLDGARPEKDLAGRVAAEVLRSHFEGAER